ncbi:MAG TPA: peptidoglycan DD-metalloendopeptidase family protein [Actinomycetota bacterium]|nr:peptidoglycan DD-metalloendopeptidase family protein [Actinomycetota bacterium]
MRRPRPRRVVAFVVLQLFAASAAAANETANWVPFTGGFSISRTFKHSGGHSTPGIDFRIPAGTPIRAAGPGTVVGIEEGCKPGHRWCSGRRGNYVQIAHPAGRHSRYLHLRPHGVTVSLGEQVERGAIIGYSGNTGDSTGPHLHYDELLHGSRVYPGPMYALHGSETVVYRNWPAADEHVIRNDGYPAIDLTVTVEGAGSVTSSPEGIDCGSDCDETYSPGSVVVLTAQPDDLYTFAGWGGACSGTDPCELQMRSPTEVTATFTLVP